MINQDIEDEVPDEENFDSGANISDFEDYGMEDNGAADQALAA